jgi:hypothetical protein
VLTALERLNDNQTCDSGMFEITDFVGRLNVVMRRHIASSTSMASSPTDTDSRASQRARTEVASMVEHFQILMRCLLNSSFDNSTMNARRKIVRLLAMAIDSQPALARDFLASALKYLVVRYGCIDTWLVGWLVLH